MAYKSIVLARANLAWYLPLDETGGSTVADAKVGDTGTFPNGLTLANASDLPAGMGGAAPRFTGALSQYITLADAAGRDLGDTHTMVVWFKRADTGDHGAYQTIISKGDTGGAAYEMGLSDGSIGNVVYSAQASTALIKRGTTAVIDATTWHQFVVTKSGSTRHVYLDGVLDDGGADANATLVDNAQPLNIGRWIDGANQYVDGWLAHVQGYSVAWTGTDVTQDYTDATVAGTLGANSFQIGSFQEGSFQTGTLDSFQDDSFQDDSFQKPHRDLQHQVNVNAEVASGTFDVLWDPYELDALDNPEAETIGYATFAALSPTVTAVDGGGSSTNAPAEVATETLVAYQPTASVAPNGGNAAITAAANAPGASVAGGAGAGTVTGQANAPAASLAPNAGNAAETIAAQTAAASVKPNAGNAALTLAANAPGTSVAGGTGAGSVTGQANAPTSSLSPSAGNAAETIAANQPSVAIAVNTQVAALVFAALDPTVVTGSFTSPDAGNAAVTIDAKQPSASVAGSSGAATVTGSAASPASSLAVNGGNTTILFAALDPTVQTTSGATNAPAEAVGITFAALDPTVLSQGIEGGGGGRRPHGLIVQNVRRKPRPQQEPVTPPHVYAHAGLARMGIAARGATTEWDDDDTAIALLLGVF